MLTLGVYLSSAALSQDIKIHAAPQLDMPGQVDSNSPAFWYNGQFNLLNSTGDGPMRSQGSDQFHLGAAQAVPMTHLGKGWPTWIEATWVDPTGPIFGWYHQEVWGVCGAASRLAVPQIGAAVSYDGGASWRDLGIVLSAGDPINCAEQNGYFAGGNGDPFVMPDAEGQYFYFFFGHYGGPLKQQGVVMARMPFAARFGPLGNVWKYHSGEWNEPGIGGRTTPIFPARVGWEQSDTNAFWGPSLHWNPYLGQYVMLLNKSCCTAGFPQEGIYASFTKDLSKPDSWTKPKKFMDNDGWYPQVLGLEAEKGTDSQAGRRARLYIYGHSSWEIEFVKPTAPAAPSQ